MPDYISHPIGWLRYQIAMLKWVWNAPLVVGNRFIGKGETRRRTLDLMFDREKAKAPKREDFIK